MGGCLACCTAVAGWRRDDAAAVARVVEVTAVEAQAGAHVPVVEDVGGHAGRGGRAEGEQVLAPAGGAPLLMSCCDCGALHRCA